MLAFSTCWNSHRHTDGEAMIDEILDLGFDTVELSHGLLVSHLPGLKRAYEAGKMKVAGVHNFFPSPIGVLQDSPDCYQFTSHREGERELAVNYTKKSLENASAFNASYIVMHMGGIPLLKREESTSLLQRLVQKGKINTREYARTKGEFVRRRNKNAPLYFSRAKEALVKVRGWAEESGIKLGVEGRSHFEQIPNEDEMLSLMREYADDPFIGYWHDFGHIQRKHNLLLLDHDQFLESMSPYVIGAHVNDVRWPRTDHRVPFFGGDVDFDRLMRHIPPGNPLVWELSHSREAPQIKESLAMWKEKFPQHI